MSKTNMPLIVVNTTINAPIDRVFNLARSIDLHIHSSSRTKEQAVAGKTHGLIELDEEVEWRAKHFGLWHRMTNKITDFDRPYYFQDTMVKGLFKYFEHNHFF